MALEIMNKLSADELEYQRYLAREKYLMDENSKKKYAEYKMNKVKEEIKEMEIARQKAEEDKQKAEKDKQKAEVEKQKAEVEKQKAEAEKQKAEAEKQKAEEDKQKLEEQLKEVEAKAKKILVNQLKKKFKGFPYQYEEKVMDLSQEIISEISANIFDLENIEDLKKYF